MTQRTPPSDIPYAAPVHYETVDATRMRDASHLKTLTICHYIWGPIVMLFSSIFLVHVGIGIAMVSGGFPTGPTTASANAAPPAWMGWIFIAMGTILILLGWTIGILSILSGRWINARRRRVFSLVVAGLNCLQMPLGTVLGVFTLIVLMRDSVQAEYRGRS